MIVSACIYLICLLFVALWLYASVIKLADMRKFRNALSLQVFPKWIGFILACTLPFLELGLAGALIYQPFRLYGMYTSLLLMTVFTIYTGGAAFEFYRQYPCPCGGIFTRMGWKKHFKVNLVFTVLAFIAILLMSSIQL